MKTELFFASFPYVSVVVFLIGSIYRYKVTAYKFSSLSSEFLEGRQLYWGSMPFHIGIIFLFFGHLIAFLFPRQVLLWNGHPVRLLILETTALVFGLSVLVGVILLIRRRILNKRVRTVTTKMDMIVLFLLLTQVISGLWIAYFHRWGSSWFAAVLTPYLRSVFLLKPDTDAIAKMPFVIQLHVISAITIIVIIPFTRLVHFLVPPVSYIWRGYQSVIWYKRRGDVKI